MMVRVFAFALHASESLSFGKGISTDDEPDLWERDLTGAIGTWIEVGQPDERRIRKAAGRADQVVVYSYSPSGRNVWWEQNSADLARLQNLTVMNLSSSATRELASLADRTMRLNCTIQEGQVWLADDRRTVLVEPETLKAPAAALR